MQLKVKCSDIVSFSYPPSDCCHYGEIGPGRKHDDEGSMWFEVYPVRRSSKDRFTYTTPVWVQHTWIRQHFSVRKVDDFHKAWIAFGFNPVVIADADVVFELLFDEPIDTPNAILFRSVNDLFEREDDDRSLRSVDTYSTDESEDDESFITYTDSESEEHEHECECDHCEKTKQSVAWFDRDWKPTDETEIKVKSFIEYLEHKYTTR